MNADDVDLLDHEIRCLRHSLTELCRVLQAERRRSGRLAEYHLSDDVATWAHKREALLRQGFRTRYRTEIEDSKWEPAPLCSPGSFFPPDRIPEFRFRPPDRLQDFNAMDRLPDEVIEASVVRLHSIVLEAIYPEARILGVVPEALLWCIKCPSTQYSTAARLRTVARYHDIWRGIPILLQEPREMEIFICKGLDIRMRQSLGCRGHREGYLPSNLLAEFTIMFDFLDFVSGSARLSDFCKAMGHAPPSNAAPEPADEEAFNRYLEAAIESFDELMASHP